MSETRNGSFAMLDKRERASKKVARLATLIVRQRAKVDALAAELETERQLLQVLHEARNRAGERYEVTVASVTEGPVLTTQAMCTCTDTPAGRVPTTARCPTHGWS